MLRHLRLARARGSLTAPNSRVQDRALEYLLGLEEFESNRDRLEQVQRLVLSPGVDRAAVQEAWPEFFRDDPYEAAMDEEGNFDIDRVDDSKVSWGTPQTLDEDAKIAAWIAHAEAGASAHGDELEIDLDEDWRE